MSHILNLKDIVESATDMLFNELAAAEQKIDSLEHRIREYQQEISGHKNQVGYQERRIEELLEQLRHAYLSDSSRENLNKEIIKFLGSDRFIEAIKFTRTVTGWGLKEAKEYVEVIRDGAVK